MNEVYLFGIIGYITLLQSLIYKSLSNRMNFLEKRILELERIIVDSKNAVT